MTASRAAILGAALLVGAAPARAQQCGLDLPAGLATMPGVGLCSQMTSTSSSASLWAMPGLASQPTAYDAFLDAISLIPRRDGLRGWVTAEASARLVSPRLGPLSLVGEFGAVGLARLDLPARSLDYFRSDTLADSLYWSFDGVAGLGVVFRSIGAGALVQFSPRLTVGASVELLEAKELVGGRVTGGMLESFDGLDVDLQVADFSDVDGSGAAFGFLALLSYDRFRAGLSFEHVGSPPRLDVRSRLRQADSTYSSTEDAVDALVSTDTVGEVVEVDLPTRMSLSAGRALGPRTWLWVDSDLVLADGYRGGDRIGARIVARPAPWVALEAGGGWSSGVDASLGIGLTAGRVTFTLDGRGALNGRDVRFATGLAVH